MNRRAKVGQRLAHGGQRLAKGSVAGSWVATLLEVAASRGADPAALARAVGLSPEGPDPTARVPISVVLALFEEAAQHTGDSMIGLHMGQEAKPRTFNALGYVAMGATTLGEAVLHVPRYERVVYDGGQTTLTRLDDEFTLAWTSGVRGALDEPEAAEPRSLRPLNEAIVAGWIAFGRWIAGVEYAPARVRFRHVAPREDERRAYDDFFGCPISFGAADNAVVFPGALLSLPLIHRDDAMQRVMREQAEAALRDLDARARCSRRVASYIRGELAHEVPTVARTARALGLSERTLRRQLAAEGRGFQDLLAEVRLELAEHHLANPARSLLDVACLLGYAEQSAFSTAFRAWTGMSPSAWRALRSGSR